MSQEEGKEGRNGLKKEKEIERWGMDGKRKEGRESKEKEAGTTPAKGELE